MDETPKGLKDMPPPPANLAEAVAMREHLLGVEAQSKHKSLLFPQEYYRPQPEPVPRSRRMRRAIVKLTVGEVRTIKGHPLHGLMTLVGKAERLPKHHPFRQRIARRLLDRRRHQQQLEEIGRATKK